jgi:tRNA pseudouridine55 synthase
VLPVVVQRVRKTLGGRRIKVGHGGTLDPLATGVLVLGVGRGCKELGQMLNGSTNSYVASAEMGLETDTEDQTGKEVLTAQYEHVTAEGLQDGLRAFTGRILQTPPRYSALRVKGKRAYELARAGESFHLAPREVSVHSLALTGFAAPRFDLTMTVGSGFYVRTLITDVARSQASAAHMVNLQRTQRGRFLLADALPQSEWSPEAIRSLLDIYGAHAGTAMRVPPWQAQPPPQPPPPPPLSPEKSAELAAVIDAFVTADTNVEAFPSSLSSAERRAVHQLARQRGLYSKSRGQGEARRAVVRHPGAPAEAMDPHSVNG